MHNVYVENVGLPLPVHAEAHFFFVVICAAWFSAARNCANHPYLPTCKAKANEQGKWLRNQDCLHVLYASWAAL